MKSYAFGIDIGGTTVKLGLFRTDGSLLEKWEIPTRTENGGSRILPDISEAVNCRMEKCGLCPDDIAGIGMGIPGPVSGGQVVNRCVNLGWGVLPVAKEMAALTGIANIRAANDANVAALGEMWQGGGKGYQNVVMVTLGTGVGGGVIADGRIISGAFGAGGEIGHIRVSRTETEVCGCGRTGCLEQYASASGIVRLAGKRLRETETDSVLRACDELSAKTIFEAAKGKDALALAVTEEAADMLGLALSYVSCVTDPEIYVIGGGVSKAGKFLLDAVASHFAAHAFHASKEAKFALAQLGNDAGMYGAVKLVLPG